MIFSSTPKFKMICLGIMFSLFFSITTASPSKKKHHITVSSEPTGLTFKVIKGDQQLIFSGKTPFSVDAVGGNEMKVELYYAGKVVATQDLGVLEQDAVVNFIGKE